MSQAEHGYNSPVWLVTDDRSLAEEVMQLVPRYIEGLPEVNRDNAAAASYWLAKGADHDARDKTMHRTPLHECAHFSGVRGTQELLLLAGADVNAIDEFGRTPVFYANFADVAEIFLKYGADLSVRDKDGLTALESRKKNGWHLPDDLKLVLEGKSQAE